MSNELKGCKVSLNRGSYAFNTGIIHNVYAVDDEPVYIVELPNGVRVKCRPIDFTIIPEEKKPSDTICISREEFEDLIKKISAPEYYESYGEYNSKIVSLSAIVVGRALVKELFEGSDV